MINKIKYNILFVTIVAFATLSSCKKNFLREELNNDPTSLESPDPKVILPTTIANLAYYYGGDVTRYNALITQQVVGGGNQWIAYQNYNFVNADFDKASTENERNAVILRMSNGQRITFVQVAGLIARRILCYTKPGEWLKRGERYGFIRFGSRVDVYLPLNATPLVSIGQKVKATETILARID